MSAGWSDALGIAGQVAGGFMQAQGQRAAAESQAAAVRAQAAAFEANARIAEQNAQAALTSAAEDKARRERIGKARLAQSSVKFLKGGVVLSGSPLAVLGEEAVQEALAAEDLAYEGRIKATQFRNQATLQNFFSSQALSKANYIEDVGSHRSFTTLLGTTSGVFNTLAEIEKKNAKENKKKS